MQQGCKYVILAPLHLKVHAFVFNVMNRDDSLTCLSYCHQQLQRLLRSGSIWESLSAGSSSSSLSVFGDLRKRLVADTWSANDRDCLKCWLVSNDMAPCRLFAVHSLCPLLSAPSPQLLAREVSSIVASVAAEWLCPQRFPVRGLGLNTGSVWYMIHSCGHGSQTKCVIIHAEHVVHRRGYCFHFGCMFVCLYVC